MRIYLASRYERREELAAYAAELRERGHEVDARWLNGDHTFEDRAIDAGELHQDAVIRFAREDLEDLLVADCCISFTEPPRAKPSRGGRHAEFGIALAHALRLIVVGYREHVFHWLPQVEYYPTWEEAKAAL